LADLDIGHKIIDKLSRDKSIQAEVYIVEGSGANIVISEGKVEDCKVTASQGIGLRVLSGDRWGNAYTSGLDAGNIDKIITMALANMNNTTSDEYNRLPRPPETGSYFSGDLHIYDPGLKEVSLDDKIKMALLMEKMVLGYDQRIKSVFQSEYSDGEFFARIISSTGIDQSSRGTSCSLSLAAVAEGEGQTQVGAEFLTRRFYNELNMEQVVKIAGWRAVSILGAKPVKTSKADIIFDSLVGCEFLGLIAGGLCADSIQRGKSLFKNKLHKQIASPLVNIQDNGTLSGGSSTSVFDDEGVPSQKTVLVKNGILEGYLYDTYTAGKDKVKSTGNANRGSFKGTPGVGISNFFIEKGKTSREALIGQTKDGFYVMEVMGMHMADPISGDFSVGASGLWIKNGQLGQPVQGVTIAGNIIELLNSIDGVGDDLKFYGSVGSPTLRIRDIMVSGT
jgi:PmbA protein